MLFSRIVLRPRNPAARKAQVAADKAALAGDVSLVENLIAVGEAPRTADPALCTG